MVAPAAAPQPRLDTPLLLSFLATTLIWGSTWLVIKEQLGVVPPSWSVAYRFLAAGAVAVVLCLATGRSLRLGRPGHAFALAIGVLQFMFNFNFVYRAEQHLASGLVALLYTLLVGSNALLGWLLLRQKVSLRFVIGSVIGIAGVALLVGRDLGAGPQMGFGLLMGLAGVASASSANILQATPFGRRLPLESTLALSLLYGGLLDAAFALATAGPPVADPRPAYWLGVAYLAVFASVFAFLIYYAMIRRIGAARAGYANVLIPVVAMGLSTVFEGYRWTAAGAVGAVLALSGLAVALGSRK